MNVSKTRRRIINFVLVELGMSMHFSIFILFSIFLWVASCESPVVTLDSDTYHDFISSNSDVLIKHYTNVILLFCIEK